MAAALAAAPDSPAVDADNPPTVAGDWDNALASRSLPELREKLAFRRRGPGKSALKVLTTIRFDADVLEAFRSSGAGWQTRMNAVLREWMKTQINAVRDNQ